MLNSLSGSHNDSSVRGATLWMI